jgi:pyruvate dehydrogenase E2 component (dihydrolipoamide acetyltransferase)
MNVAMEYGVILKWLKNEGEKVEKGEPVVEIFGEKNEFELEAPESGILLKILCDVDDEIPISEPIAIIGEKGEEIPDVTPKKLNEQQPSQPEPVRQTAESTSAKATPTTTVSTSTLPGGRIKASPRAKKKAEELGVDIALVKGTGPEGRIVEDDVIRYEGTAPTAISDEREIKMTEPMTPLRRTIARRMTESSHNPHITMITEIDMTEVAFLRNEINQRLEKTLGIRVSFNDIIVKAVADTLEKFPKFNATLVGNQIRMFADINIGVAMATEDGLIVPVVKEANAKSISEIAQETKELVKKARNDDLGPADLEGGTFTVSNLGPFEVDLFIPVINPPETAILALGAIKKKPVVVEDMIAIRHTMMASCAVDHRVLDGAPAGAFLASLKDTLENPYFMKI